MTFPTERAARRYAKRVVYTVSCVEYTKGGARVQCFDPTFKPGHCITLRVNNPNPRQYNR
jgi:hypothetical protein